MDSIIIDIGSDAKADRWLIFASVRTDEDSAPLEAYLFVRDVIQTQGTQLTDTGEISAFSQSSDRHHEMVQWHGRHLLPRSATQLRAKIINDTGANVKCILEGTIEGEIL
jgi:hypothetical protein